MLEQGSLHVLRTALRPSWEDVRLRGAPWRPARWTGPGPFWSLPGDRGGFPLAWRGSRYTRPPGAAGAAAARRASAAWSCTRRPLGRTGAPSRTYV